MSEVLVFDIEANGLLDTVTTIHCICLREWGGKVYAYHDDPKIRPKHGSIQDGLDRLEKCKGTIAHNQTGYDYPAIQKLYPKWVPPPILMDTLVCSRGAWSDIKTGDYGRVKRKTLPGQLIGTHSLEAWGYRMSFRKEEYKKGEEDRFVVFDRKMLLYCSQDTAVCQSLAKLVLKQRDKGNFPRLAQVLEQEFARILMLQEHAGFVYDDALSDEILADLQVGFAQVDRDARKVYPSKWTKYKRTYRGKTHKEHPFNPGSRQQIVTNLIEHRGWTPQYHTNAGNVKLSNEMLGDLPWPEGKLFAERFDIAARLAQLDHGEKSWRNNLREDGRISAVAIHNNTVTHRCSHKVVTSVPKKNVKHGGRMRELFTVPEGRVLVGWDLSGLEARMLAHYLAAFDGGAYAKVVLEGDIHQLTVDAIGHLICDSPFHDTVRDAAKTSFYGWLYGAGDWQLGFSVGGDPGKGRKDKRAPARLLGAKIRRGLLSGVPGLAKLVEAVKKAGKKNGWVRTLDGRITPTRSEHAMLNTALQSAGAIVMKLATVMFHRILVSEHGLVPFDWWMDPLDADFVQVGHWHDEAQTECEEWCADHVLAAGPEAVRRAGVELGLRIPLDGDSLRGTRWSETH